MTERWRPRARTEIGAPLRSLAELRFAIAEAICDRCAKTELASESMLLAEGRLLARCAHCSARREIVFTPPATSSPPPAFSLGEGPAPSAVFDAGRLWAIASQWLSRAAADPSVLATLSELSGSRRSLARARTALVELEKHHPLDPEQESTRRQVLALWDRHEVAAPPLETRPGALATPPPPAPGPSSVGPDAIERALRADEALLAVRDGGTFEALHLYALVAGRLLRRASSRDPADLAEPAIERLRARRIRLARAYSPGEFLWSAEAGFTVWSPGGVLADGRDGALEVGSGVVLQKGQARRVVSFFDEDDIGHRGVAVERRDGGTVVVVEERDSGSVLDPTYGMDNVMIDAAWGTFLGRDLAAWLGVEHKDELP